MPEEYVFDDASIISKITMASIRCNPGAVKNEGAPNPLPLARIYGAVNEVKPKPDKVTGQVYISFVGTFEAINLQSGEVYKSGVMYLPAGISEQFEKAIDAQKDKAGDDNVSMEFAFEIGSIPSKNPAGYSYQARALRSAAAIDPLKELREGMLKALPAGQVIGSKQKALEGETKKR